MAHRCSRLPDDIYGEEVVCYIVAKPGETITGKEIKQHYAPTLPDYEAPKHVYFAAELPKNDCGKVKRNVLTEQWMAEYASA